LSGSEVFFFFFFFKREAGHAPISTKK